MVMAESQSIRLRTHLHATCGTFLYPTRRPFDHPTPPPPSLRIPRNPRTFVSETLMDLSHEAVKRSSSTDPPLCVVLSAPDDAGSV